jgi:hypothetical protein
MFFTINLYLPLTFKYEKFKKLSLKKDLRESKCVFISSTISFLNSSKLFLLTSIFNLLSFLFGFNSNLIDAFSFE